MGPGGGGVGGGRERERERQWDKSAQGSTRQSSETISTEWLSSSQQKARVRRRRNDWSPSTSPTCPVLSPTTRSAMKVSSVSPLRCDTITPHPAAWDILHASMASVTLPIWLTLSSRALQAFLSMPILTRLGLVTSKSSLQRMGGGGGAPLTEPVTTKQSMFKNSLYITAWSPSTWGSEL